MKQGIEYNSANPRIIGELLPLNKNFLIETANGLGLQILPNSQDPLFPWDSAENGGKVIYVSCLIAIGTALCLVRGSSSAELLGKLLGIPRKSISFSSSWRVRF